MEQGELSDRMLENVRRTGFLVITDVGSTTTKALLLARTPVGGLRFEASADVTTTVEKPREDVCIGVGEAIMKLESISGEKLSRGRGMPSVPYLSTSSAGGGLQMLVFGLTSVETGRIAENTASNAGGVVLRMISIDDELQAVEQMQAIQNLHPDMIMLAGGTDGGAIAGVVRLAELLALSDPQPKFRLDMKIPLVYCGNIEARSFVSEVLENVFEVHIVDNVRPSLEEMNMEPARKEVHRLFMENVMERAPGYSVLKEYVISDILPTPAGVENMMRLYSGHTGENILMMDMGGATTDIFSCITGDYNRTVAANTGMSYSMANTMRRSGIEQLMKHLPLSFCTDEVRDYIYNKTIAPTYVPRSAEEILVEQAAAICGIDSSWKEHLDTCYQIKRTGFLDRMKARNRKEFEETFMTSEKETFNLSDIDLVIGSGGVISHAEKERAFWMLAEGFRPFGVTCLAIDRDFRSPHLGVLSEIDSQEALRLFHEECLEKLGWVIAPFGDFEEGDRVMTVINTDTRELFSMSWGDLRYLDPGGSLKLELEGNASLGEADKYLSTDLPVLIDCRNRFEGASGKVLSDSGIPAFSHDGYSVLRSPIKPAHGEIEVGEWEVENRLPYQGTIHVRPGDLVEPGTLLGENRYNPPKLYIIDLNRITGYDRHLTPEEIRDGLLVREGDRIRLNEPLYEVHRKGLTGFDFTFHSTVRGRITRIEKNGLIVVREIQDYDEKPHVVDIAGPLDIKPRHIVGYLKRREGDFVEAGQILASDISSGKAATVTSPTSGVVKNIDRKKGTVTVQFDIDPVRMLSHVFGEVTEVIPDHMVRVRGKGSRLWGIIGFGGQTSGILREIRNIESEVPERDSVIFTTAPITVGFLRLAAESGVNGIIVPSIPATHWMDYCGSELGVAVTGDEDIPFTLVLTAGFGHLQMDEECAEFLRGSEGNSVFLSGRTQIRAGVTRPTVIV